MQRFLTIGLGLCIGLATVSQATDRYVDYANGDDINHNGTSFSGDAYKTLQKALSVAGAGDTIHVAANTYYPDDGGGQMNGDETASFGMREDMTLLGGYPAGGGARNPAVNVTILSGDIDQNGLDADNGQHVVTAYSRTNAIVIDGFTIKQGYADRTDDEHGGGILVRNCSNVTVENCLFTQNQALELGAGIFVHHTSAGPSASTTTVENCDFEDNEAGDAGGGLAHLSQEKENHDIVVTLCTFYDNRVENVGMDTFASGGAMDFQGSASIPL